jgi:hypothetical protein
MRRVMALREVLDDSGVLWMIYDIHPTAKRGGVPQVQPDFAEGWLCFHSPDAKRRIAGIPVDWDQLQTPALLALMATAVLVAARPK